MKCFAIATQSASGQMSWLLPGKSGLSALFAKTAEAHYQSEISDLLGAVQPNGQHFLRKDGYCLHIQKIGQSYCAFVTDEVLSISQLYYLTTAILIEGIDKNIVAKDMETYSKHRQIANVQADLDELKDKMLKNIELLIQRGEAIDTLVERTEGLSEDAQSFKIKAQELNRCWPLGCAII